MIRAVANFVGVSETDDGIIRDSCEETGRIDIQKQETDDGSDPTPAQLEAWKRGELTLYAVTYTGYAVAVESSATKSPQR